GVRTYSHELRTGLASTLALIGVHGERIDAGTAGNGSDWTAVGVSRLLQAANADPTCNTWISLSDVLTLLAEASPDAFLAAVTKGLDGESPLLASLFVEDASPFGGGNHHTHLLW